MGVDRADDESCIAAITLIAPMASDGSSIDSRLLRVMPIGQTRAEFGWAARSFLLLRGVRLLRPAFCVRPNRGRARAVVRRHTRGVSRVGENPVFNPRPVNAMDDALGGGHHH